MPNQCLLLPHDPLCKLEQRGFKHKLDTRWTSPLNIDMMKIIYCTDLFRIQEFPLAGLYPVVGQNGVGLTGVDGLSCPVR